MKKQKINDLSMEDSVDEISHRSPQNRRYRNDHETAWVFDLPEEYAASIFHIYSEALSNVMRHARARRIAVALTITPHEVGLVVRDNGIGISEQDSHSSRGGNAGMRARAQSHKGLCEFAGTSSAGTTVTASLPIAQAS
jgi:signal transduction histidine kinase